MARVASWGLLGFFGSSWAAIAKNNKGDEYNHSNNIDHNDNDDHGDNNNRSDSGSRISVGLRCPSQKESV